MRKSKQWYALVLTGKRRDRRYQVMVRGAPAWLTDLYFETVCSLASARTKGEGFLVVPAIVIHRIRLEIDDPKEAWEMFECGGEQEYRIRWPASQIAADESFFELPSPEVVPLKIRRTIQRRLDRVVIR